MMSMYTISVTQLSQNCVWLCEQETQQQQQVCSALPLTAYQITRALVLCLAWQQRKVNGMNKTYLNQSPLPWEMSNCQYSLMGKHRAGPRGRTVYRTALIKMLPGQSVSSVSQKHTLVYLTPSDGLLSHPRVWSTGSSTFIKRRLIGCDAFYSLGMFQTSISHALLNI